MHFYNILYFIRGAIPKYLHSICGYQISHLTSTNIVCMGIESASSPEPYSLDVQTKLDGSTIFPRELVPSETVLRRDYGPPDRNAYDTG